MIYFACPRCGAPHSQSIEWAGHTAACHQCQQIFTVPLATGQLIAPPVRTQTVQPSPGEDSPEELAAGAPRTGCTMAFVVLLCALMVFGAGFVIVAIVNRNSDPPARTTPGPVGPSAGDSLPELYPNPTSGVGSIVVLMLVLVIVLAVIPILAIIILARDVRARSPEQAAVWMLVILFFGLLGAIAWLAARPPRKLDHDRE